jgi:hypothetical protein
MRKRSKYRPKGVIQDTVSHVLGGFRLVQHTPHAVTLKIKNHQAMASMVAGTGSRDDIDILIAAMNVTEALAIAAELGHEYRTEITAAQDAILAMAKRGLERSRFLFTGPELTAMNLGMEIHDAQLDACTVSQLEKALDFVARELLAKRAKAIV